MDEDFKKLSQDVEEIKKAVKGIKGYFVRQEIYQWLMILVFVVPFIVMGFWLWPMLQGFTGQYQNIMSKGLGAVSGEDVLK